jgi:hypothetical protein
MKGKIGLVNPIFFVIAGIPHFIFGALLAARNWRGLGFPQKAQNTVKWSIIGTLAIIIIAFYIPADTLKKMWSVGIGVNAGVGMALRTLQLPEYTLALSKGGEKV